MVTYKIVNGLEAIQIENDSATALVYLHGAHVASYIPKGAKDVLWMSTKSEFAPMRPLRGGIPVCWPWFGAPDTSVNPKAQSAHGIARLLDWSVLSVADTTPSCTEVVLQLTDSAESRVQWDHKFRLSLKISVGATLKLALTTENTDAVPFTVAEALHTYFNVGDISATSVAGFDGAQYIDTVPGAASPTGVVSGAITFGAECDRVFLDFERDVEICDNANSRRIKIVRQGSASSVVWNPWIAKSIRMPDFGDTEYTGMLCVESANVRANAKNIAPGASSTLFTEISLIAGL